ncbi:MAG: nuclear transport factor 2 family protein [Bacteroidetes bacterium]|nr:nuclear transport factor 2 family protein [Bacteroidota bacterium]MDA1121508.1 nuclear transport factor 2 family protein [Bacteroidota bacterium]
MEGHLKVIQSFYQAFKDHDVESMVQHYDLNVRFHDPAFGHLEGSDASNMWRMLIERGQNNFQIEYSDIRSIGDKVAAHWEAKYPFSKTGRMVHNKIDAEFEFVGDKIIQHIDTFNFWKWSSIALGTPGMLLGWSPIVKGKVRRQCLLLLSNYTHKPK